VSARDLIGGWELQSWGQSFDDGRLQHPFGEQPTGQLIYTASGHMSGLVAASTRVNLTQGQWTSPPAEAAAAYSTFLAYGGTYEVVDDEVIHHIKVSLFPDWAGVHQRRRARLENDVLNLIGRVEEGTTNARTVVLVWRRVE
jgi:hypothetical protein